jgi:hypothetical protein
MTTTQNWQAPISKTTGEAKVHRGSRFQLKGGTLLTLCGARIDTSTWTSTTRELTCSVCARLARS